MPLSDPGFVLSGLVSIVSDKIIQCTVSTTLFESYESYEYFRIFHTFCTCFILPAKFIPLVWAVKSHTTGRNLQSGPVHATLCQGLQVLQEEMNEKKRERERENPTIRAWGHTWALQNVMWSMNPMPINNRSNAYKLKTQLDQKPWWVEQKTCHSRIPARHCFLVSNRHKAYSMALLPSFGFSFGSCFLSSL